MTNEQMESIAPYLKPWMDLTEEERVPYYQEAMSSLSNNAGPNIFSPLPGQWPIDGKNISLND